MIVHANRQRLNLPPAISCSPLLRLRVTRRLSYVRKLQMIDAVSSLLFIGDNDRLITYINHTSITVRLCTSTTLARFFLILTSFLANYIATLFGRAVYSLIIYIASYHMVHMVFRQLLLPYIRRVSLRVVVSLKETEPS